MHKGNYQWQWLKVWQKFKHINNNNIFVTSLLYQLPTSNRYVSIHNEYRNGRITEDHIQSLQDVMPDIFSKEKKCQIKKELIGNVLISLCKRKQQVVLKYDPDSLEQKTNNKALSSDRN